MQSIWPEALEIPRGAEPDRPNIMISPDDLRTTRGMSGTSGFARNLRGFRSEPIYGI